MPNADGMDRSGEPTTSEVLAALPDRGAVLDDLVHFLDAAWASFEHPRPAEPHADPDLVDRLSAAMPTAPSDPRHALLDAVSVLDASVSPARPLYLAYVGSTGLETGVLAAALAATYDANLATVAGAADRLDQQAVRWLGEFVGFPAVEGHFTSGGQTSNLTALLAAREQALPGVREHGMADRRAAVYCSVEAHHSVARAVEACGFGRASLRTIQTDDVRRMDVDLLAETIAADRAAGIVPVAVVATAGTTLTGSVDPLAAIADVCERHDTWLHVDGAYGLPAAASTRAGHLFAGLERADSVTVDAHKWLGLQKSCSGVLLRRAGALHAAFGHDEKYMLHEDVANPVDSTFEYSRPFRSLRWWLALRIHGADQFRTWIDATLRNAERFTEAVRRHPDFELLHEPQLSTVCFRHAPGDIAPDDLDRHNEALARAVQRDGRVFLAPAVVDDRICLRVCFVNFRTTTEDVDLVLDVVGELVGELAGAELSASA